MFLTASLGLLTSCTPKKYTPPPGSSLANMQFIAISGGRTTPYLCEEGQSGQWAGGEVFPASNTSIMKSVGEYHSIDIKIPANRTIIVGHDE